MTDRTGAAVRTRGLTRRFGEVVAVADLDLVVPNGTVFGLIGPNGAGKTTTFAMLASLLTPSAGEMSVLGLDPVADAPALRARLGYMPDALGVYDGVRVDEYLRFFAGAYHLPPGRWDARVAELLDLVGLVDKRAAMVASLSRGMKQRLSLARALIHDPDLLILDEPASGLDPRARVQLRDLLFGLRARGTTVVVSSHILTELQELCDEVAIMVGGRIVVAGPPRQVAGRRGGPRRVRVRLRNGSERTISVADEAAQAALLTRLVDEGVPVVEFSRVDTGLESVFLELTEDGP